MITWLYRCEVLVQVPHLHTSLISESRAGMRCSSKQSSWRWYFRKAIILVHSNRVITLLHSIRVIILLHSIWVITLLHSIQVITLLHFIRVIILLHSIWDIILTHSIKEITLTHFLSHLNSFYQSCYINPIKTILTHSIKSC